MNESVAPLNERPLSRLTPVSFDAIELDTSLRYLVKGIVPREGLTVLWGPPKCGKSFIAFDIMMHVALGWSYRDRKVVQGPVVYVACEGGYGFKARVEAFRQLRLAEEHQTVPFYLVPTRLDLVAEHKDLISIVSRTLGGQKPVAVVLDTLNRSLTGSESSDEDMTAYVRAADSVCEAFNCAVVVVHHCGIESSRPRGHTSLTGAADAQIAVKRNAAGTIEANVEFMKDGPEGDSFAGRLESVQVGLDDDGEPITSCVVEPVDPITDFRDSSGPKLTPNQDTMLSILIEAGPGGRDVEKWNEEARDVGIGIKRKATLHDIRNGLKKKGLVHTTMGRWYVTNV